MIIFSSWDLKKLKKYRPVLFMDSMGWCLDFTAKKLQSPIKSYISAISKKTFLHNVKVNKKALENTIYTLENINFRFGRGLRFTYINIGYVLQNHRKVQYIKKYTLLHSAPLNKKVLEWAIYSTEAIKIRIMWCLDFTSKT